MKKQTSEKTKYFRFHFSKTIYACAAAALVLCIAAIALSVWRMIRLGTFGGVYDFLKYPLLILIALAGFVLVISMMIKSQYIVDDKNFTTQFGLIKSKCPLKNITSVILDTDTNKLTVYMGEAYSVISVQPSWNENFVRALLKGNPDIDYSYTIKENKPPEETDKKK